MARDKGQGTEKQEEQGLAKEQQSEIRMYIRNKCLPTLYLQCEEISLYMHARRLQPSRIQCFYPACHPAQ